MKLLYIWQIDTYWGKKKHILKTILLINFKLN